MGLINIIKKALNFYKIEHETNWHEINNQDIKLRRWKDGTWEYARRNKCEIYGDIEFWNHINLYFIETPLVDLSEFFDNITLSSKYKGEIEDAYINHLDKFLKKYEK